MSTPDADPGSATARSARNGFGTRAGHPAERTLFRGLVDDAAVFPPGLAPLPQAVVEHLRRQSEPYADLVGPLLLPARDIAGLAGIDRSGIERSGIGRGRHLTVGVIGRPGTELAVVAQALQTLAGDPTVTVSGVEIGWAPGWEAALGWGPPLSVEVPRGADLATAVGDVARHTSEGVAVQAKLRTGSTDTVTVPSATELATFIRLSVDHDLGFKLTGGLHHAFTHTALTQSAFTHSAVPNTALHRTALHRTSPIGEDQFGFLNVLAATRYALAHAAEVPELETILLQRDPEPTIEIIARMSEADASVVRAFFTSYGCCGVLDPIRDLSALGLIEETV